MSNNKHYKSRSPRKSGQFRKSDKEAAGLEKAKQRDVHNHPEWYIPSNINARDVASISFNNASGLAVSLDGTVNNLSVMARPGIMVLYQAPVPGVCTDSSHALNIAAKNIYSYVRHANSGHTNYDAPDLMLYLLAVDSLYSFYAWCVRLYGVMRVYTQQNRYFGDGLIRAMGIDPSAMRPEIANFRAWLNQFAIRIGPFAAPNNMPLFQRHTWLYSNVFLDEDDYKGQMYLYNPLFFYRYDEYSGAGKLVAQPFGVSIDSINGLVFANPMTFADIRGAGEALLNAVMQSEDMNIMSGDVLKAYGSDNLWKLSLIDESYAVLPKFDEVVLSQIHNTSIINATPVTYSSDSGLTYDWTSFEIIQDVTIGSGNLRVQPTFFNAHHLNESCYQILDFWHTDPTPEDVIEATRNKVFTRYEHTADYGLKWSSLITCGSDITVTAKIFSIDHNGLLTAYDAFGSPDYANWSSSLLTHVSRLSNFNEYPIYIPFRYSVDGTSIQLTASRMWGEISNFTLVDWYDVAKMHDTALLTQLAVPYLGNVQKSNP